jgi:hypothetical protein
MLLSAVSPVLAEPAQKFSVTLDTKGSTISPAEKSWTTNGGIVHSIGGVRGGPVYLWIGAGPKITGTYIETATLIVNTKTGESVTNFNKMVCTFPGGSFEGEKTARTTTEIIEGKTVVVAMEQHGVLHGSGIYEGQTMKIGYDWVLTDPILPKIYTGVLIVPNPD